MRPTTWRQGAAAIATVFLLLGGCGGGDEDDGSGDGVAADLRGGDGGSPPTAGPGEQGVFAGPSGGPSADPEEFLIPGCGDIDADSRLEHEEYEELLAELQCIFDNADEMPEGAVAEAERAAELARDGIEARDGPTDPTGPEPETTYPETTEPDPGTTEPEPEPEPEPETQTETTTSG